MAYDFTRPFVDSSQLPTYVALDVDEARQYGKTVRALPLSGSNCAKLTGSRPKVNVCLLKNPSFQFLMMNPK